jgi:putative membrane protein
MYLIKGLKSVVIFLVFGYFSISSSPNWYMLIFPVLLGVTALIGPFINYYFTKFHIEDENFIINKGWLQKENKSVPLERIQSINISQNLVQRILGIAALEVETAGSKGKELEIPGLEKDFADQLKEFLNESKEKANDFKRIEDPSETDIEHLEAPNETVFSSPKTQSLKEEPTVILDLSIIDLLKVGITQNHLRSGGLALGVVFGFWYKIKDIAQTYFAEYVNQYSWESTFKRATITFLVAGLIVFILASIIVSVITTINKFWNFKIIKQDDYLEVTMGLLNRREVKIPLNKVQLLEFHSNPLRRLLNFHTGKLFQAQTENNKLTSIEVPACKPEQMAQLQVFIFNETIQEPETQIHANPWSHARLRFYITGSFSAVAMSAAYYLESYWVMAAVLTFLVFSVYSAYQYGLNSNLIKDDSFVVFYKGWLFKSITISPIYKTQAVEKWRSIFLVSRKEIHVKIHTAAGSRGLRYLKENQVSQLINSVNNQVLVENRKWM